MGEVVANISMSLDGFVEDASGSALPLFEWVASVQEIRDGASSTGALVCGRRLFDLTQGWGGQHPVGVPVFVVTHQPPSDWAHPDAPFAFVVDGVASAVAQAQAVAGNRTVAIATPDITRQCLDLGILDGISVDLVPVLLGNGKPFFAGLQRTPVTLGTPTVVEGQGVTHLHYRVAKSRA
jgi:dihydrofolate reductase